MFSINIENLKKTKIPYILKKTLSFCILYSKCCYEYEQIFKED